MQCKVERCQKCCRGPSGGGCGTIEKNEISYKSSSREVESLREKSEDYYENKEIIDTIEFFLLGLRYLKAMNKDGKFEIIN